MKKLLAFILSLMLVMQFTACSKNETKEENNNIEVSQESNEKIDKIAEAVKDEEADIEKTQKNVTELKDELEKKGEKMKSAEVAPEDKTKYENEQLAVAIMEMALENLEEARKNNDEEAEKEALENIEMAQSIWNWDGTTEE